MTEIWKPIPSLAGTYEASSEGQIRRAIAGQATRIGTIIKPTVSRGYHRISVHFNRKQLTRSVHRLVAEAFLGPVPAAMPINHKNGVKHDNRIENLEICTVSENTAHGYRVLGRLPNRNPNPGEQNGRAKLKDSDMPAIFAMRAQGFSQQKIAGHFGVDQTNISRVLLGKTGFKLTHPKPQK